MRLGPPANLPAALEARWAHVENRLEGVDGELPPSLAAEAAIMFVISDFVLGVFCRQPEALLARLADTEILTAEAVVASLDLSGMTEPQAMAALRRSRNVEMARIAWREQCGLADLRASLAELSALADGMIRLALAHAIETLEPRYGRPGLGDDREATLLVLGMGKLGGRELNFSSDIDLVFVYPDGVEMPGADAIAPEEYFRRLAQSLIRLLDQKTADGFVFRVDTRLRPFGASGPLAISLSAFEAYLLQHGRDWERYAYVKARLITGLEHEHDVFADLLTPFVFRRYLDYGVFDALRQMKRLIADEVKRKDMQSNIKLGPGGIREIEFIVQVFQLVRGGQEKELRDPRLLDVLERIGELEYLPGDAVEQLGDAYRYLRAVENRLQAMEDQQTHELPGDSGRRERLAFAMGLADWPALEEQVQRRRAVVAAHFDEIAWVGDTDAAAGDTGAVLAAWQSGDIARLLRDTVLAGSGVEDSLRDLRESGLYRRMDEPSRQRLAAVIVRLVPLLEQSADPVSTLSRVLPILQAICRRSAYLALLTENPIALERLLSLGGGSPLLARQMSEHPALLDELLDARLFDAPPTREELARALEQSLGNVAADDAEAYVDAIRQFQRAAVFRIAIADRLGGLPLMKVSDRLTDTAELVLESALDVAWRELERRYGRPMYGTPGEETEAGFAVIAYGKLGGLELGYGSDLDLVFLHDSAGANQQTTGPRVVDNQTFFVRLVQRLIHFLTIQTSSGRLYEIDTRLRPSGASGLMVAGWQSFSRYEREEAWTWEHQALLRSRSVAGSASLRAAFEQERREVLVNHVEREGLADAIAKMRLRMRQELSAGTRDLFDIKQDPGGLADIEFLIDYWILSNAGEYPDLVTYPDNVRQLEALEAAGLVPAQTCARMKDAYLELRARIHEISLGSGDKTVPADEFAATREWIVGIWREVFGEAG